MFYRAALPLSQATLTFVSGLIRAHRREIGSRWRALNPDEQALLVLVYLRKGETFAEVGAGFGVSTTTCWRYVEETVELLARRAPKLRAAWYTAKRAGMAYVVVDGTLIPIDRVAADRPFCSGKHKLHRVNLQVGDVHGDAGGEQDGIVLACLVAVCALVAVAGFSAPMDVLGQQRGERFAGAGCQGPGQRRDQLAAGGGVRRLRHGRALSGHGGLYHHPIVGRLRPRMRPA